MTPPATEPIFRDADHARLIGRRYRKMADEVASYPEHDGQHEKVSELRGRSAHAYRAARALEQKEPAPKRREKPQEKPWTPRQALRRAGVRVAARSDQAARNAPRKAARAVTRSGALPELGGGRTGVGGLIVYMLASIFALALLDNLLGGRGPAALSKILGFFTGAIQRLVSPSDPLLAQGVQPGQPTATTVAPAPGSGKTVSLAKAIAATPKPSPALASHP